MNFEQLIDSFDRKHLWHPYASMLKPLPALKVKEAYSCTIVLEDGTKLIDGISSWWCMIHGYNHPVLNAAIKTQLEKVSHVMFAGLTHQSAIDLGKKLLAMLPAELDTCFYADSGSVAVEAAMKMALQYQVAINKPYKNNFATIKGGYHGDTFNAMSVCDPVEGMHTIFGPSLPVRFFLPRPEQKFNDTFSFEHQEIKNLREFFASKADSLAGFILEPIVQGAGGMYFYHPLFLQELRKLCDEFGVILIFDEIATGFYRTAKPFAMDYAQTVPDLICLGKALTGGTMTLSAVVTKHEIAKAISQATPYAFMHGPTFMANPLACASACASLDLMQQGNYEQKALHIESLLKEGLEDLKQNKLIKEVRILGAIGVIEFYDRQNVAFWQEQLCARGVWLRPMGQVLYIMPPLIIEDHDLCQIVDSVKAVLKLM